MSKMLHFSYFNILSWNSYINRNIEILEMSSKYKYLMDWSCFQFKYTLKDVKEKRITDNNKILETRNWDAL